MQQTKIDELLNNLEYHELTDIQRETIALIRTHGKNFVRAIAPLLPDSRHASLWMTDFERSQDNAVRAVAVGNFPALRAVKKPESIQNSQTESSESSSPAPESPQAA